MSVPVRNPKSKHQYAYMLCLFLAEGIRTRRFTLKRAGEITEKFLANVNLVDTDEHFQSLVREMAKDFEELADLGNQLGRQKDLADRRGVERLVREFSVQAIPKDPQAALRILERASDGTVSLADLCTEFPEFGEFVQSQKPNS